MPDRPVVAFDICVLLRLAGLDVLNTDPTLCSPGDQLAADIFRTVVNPNVARLDTPFQNQIQTADHPLCWPRKINLDA